MAQITLNTRAQAQLNMLTVMFLLGMGVNLIGLPSEANGGAKTVTTILLGLHVLISIGLIVGAIMTFRLATKQSSPHSNLARWGGITIALTLIAGAATMATESNWWSYAMAAGFVVSAWVYGMLYIRTKQASKESV